MLIAEATDIKQELYLGALVDRVHRAVVFMGSAAGGVDIEKVANETPDKIITAVVDNAAGLMPYQARQIGFGMGLNSKQVSPVDQDHGRTLPAVHRQGHQSDRGQPPDH